MQDKGLLFIPDISGFTTFVNETDIEHSRLIIQELLEILINANQIGLEVSEVEGDAILFYKFGEPPALEDLFIQVEAMFSAFHKNLIAYDVRKFCQCNACLSAARLSLKVITHYGEFSTYSIKQFNKLIGKDVIVAHQLLKNNIDNNEYWLVTDSLSKSPKAITGWMNWIASEKKTEHGDIPFLYTPLSAIKSTLVPEVTSPLSSSTMSKVFSVSRVYKTDIIRLFHASGDFRYRHRWMDGVQRVEEIGHFLPRIGMKCRYIKDDGEMVMYANSYIYTPTRIEFSEAEESGRSLTYYTLEDLGNDNVRLTVDYFTGGSIFSRMLFSVFKKDSGHATFEKSLEKIAELLPDIRLLG